MSHIYADEKRLELTAKPWLKRSEEARPTSKPLTDPCIKERILEGAESYERRASTWGRLPTPVRIH